MNAFRKLLISFLPIVIIALLGAKSNEDGRAGRTDSPGETNCQSCHSSFTLNSGGGSISIQSPEMSAFQYVPGQTYNMSVTVALPSSNLFGVGIEALTTLNDNAGTLNITDAVSTQIMNATISGISRHNIVHQLGGGASTASKIFNFSWTAPQAGTGNVTFYFAGVAAVGNGNRDNGNDYVYVSSQVFTENNCSSPNTPNAINGSSTICSGSQLVYSVDSVPGATSYTWTLPSGWTGTSTVKSINVSAGNLSGTISVKANNSCGSSQVSSLSVIVKSITASPVITNATCFGSSNGSVSVSPTGGTSPYTYFWSPSGGNASQASNLSAGNYSVNITDAGGCTKFVSATVSQPTQILTSTSQVNPKCFGAATGSATVIPTGGTPNYLYSWSPSGGSSQTANNLVAGTYTVTVTDAASCTKTASVTITQPTLLSVSTSHTNTSCNGSANGNASSIVTGGTPAYQYSWSPSGALTASINNLIAGTYVVTVTDLNGCIKTISTVITEPQPITIGMVTTDASCGLANGTATATPTGGTGVFSYSWSTIPVQHTFNAVNLAAGNYDVTVTDANGCSKTSTVTINQPSDLSASTKTTNVSCHGLSNGSAVVVAAGGSPAYSYSWNTVPVQNSDTAKNLSVGSYTVIVTDQNSCSFSVSVNISEPTQLIAGAGINQSICAGSSIEIGGTPSASGGVGGYSYQWSPIAGLDSSTISNPLAAPVSQTVYSVTVADSNGCSAISTVEINVNPLPITDILSQGDTLFSTQGITYQWNLNGAAIINANDSIYIPLANGIYTVIITDSNGCTDTSADFNYASLGIFMGESSASYKVFPNPAVNQITIYSGSISASTSFTLFDVFGKCVYSGFLDENNNNINVEGFAKGFYVLIIVREGNNPFTQFIILN